MQRHAEYYERAIDIAQSSGRPLLVARSGNKASETGTWVSTSSWMRCANIARRSRFSLSEGEWDGVNRLPHSVSVFGSLYWRPSPWRLIAFRLRLLPLRARVVIAIFSGALGAMALCSRICLTASGYPIPRSQGRSAKSRGHAGGPSDWLGTSIEASNQRMASGSRRTTRGQMSAAAIRYSEEEAGDCRGR